MEGTGHSRVSCGNCVAVCPTGRFCRRTRTRYFDVKNAHDLFVLRCRVSDRYPYCNEKIVGVEPHLGTNTALV